MFFGENPFYLAARGASPEEKAEARRLLRTEGTRTEAEFYWLLDVPPGEALALAEHVMAGKVVAPPAAMGRLSRVLLSMNRLYYGGAAEETDFLRLEEGAEGLSIPDISAAVKRARPDGSAPDDVMLEGWMQSLPAEIGRAARRAAGRLAPGVYERILYHIGRRGKRGIVYVQLLSDYEEDHRRALSRGKGEAAWAAALGESHPGAALSLLASELPPLMEGLLPFYGRDGLWALLPLFASLRRAMEGVYQRGGREAAQPWLTLLTEHFSFDAKLSDMLAEDGWRMQEGRTLTPLPAPGITPRQPSRGRIPDVPGAGNRERRSPMVTRIIAVVAIVAALAACWMLLK